MIPEEIDLRELADSLRRRAPAGEPRGYLRGKTALREFVRELVGCSELEAEELVDTLELRGYVQFHGDPAERSFAFSDWEIDPGAEE